MATRRSETPGGQGPSAGAAYRVRPMRQEDIEAIIAVDAVLSGRPDPDRAGFWRGLLGLQAEPAEEPSPDRSAAPFLCEVVETAGRAGAGTLVGFAIGDVQSWQFGMPRHGRIVAIGVHPEHRRRGAARQLVDAMLRSFRKMGLRSVQCLVAPGDPLGDFFRAAGFERTKLEILDLPLL